MSEQWRVEERSGDAVALHTSWPGVDDRPDRRSAAICRVTAPAVVLGSTQPVTVIDADRAAADGVTVARRRSGGGVVLVTPEDPVWVDLWIPAGDPLWRDDVARAFDWVGDTWVAALGRSGIGGVAAHRAGYVSCTRWSRSVCFGGIGTGEVVTDDGRKVVGLSQHRSRHGAWFHGASYIRWDPAPLIRLLDMPDPERTAAFSSLSAAVVGVAELSRPAGSGPVGARQLAESVVAALP